MTLATPPALEPAAPRSGGGRLRAARDRVRPPIRRLADRLDAAVARDERAEAAAPAQPTSLTALAVVWAFTAGVAGCYALARAGHSRGVDWAFWTCELAGFLVALWRAMRPGTATLERALLVGSQAVGQSVLAVAYSPTVWRFPDAMQHWRTALSLLDTGRLFGPNAILPVSPHYPALEIVTDTLVRLTHLPLMAAGDLVAGVAHLCLALACYLLYRDLFGRDRPAAVAALLYGVVPHQFMFDTLFLYGAIGLPCFVLAVRYALLVERRRSRGDLAVASIAVLVCAVAHPLTMLILLATLAGIGTLALVVRRNRAVAVRAWLLAGLGSVVSTAWVLLVAREVPGYLSGPVRTLVSGLLAGGASSGKVAIPSAAASPFERGVIMASVGIAVLALPFGMWLLWRRRSTAGAVLAGASLLYFGVIAVRLLDANGAELATRGLTYVAVFSSAALAAVVVVLGHSRRGKALVAAGLIVFFAGNLAAGWPPVWERLPGGQHIDGFEAGVDGGNLLVAHWAADHLEPAERTACDFTECLLLGATAATVPVDNAAAVYFARTLDARTLQEIADLNIDYLVVDQRLAAQLPISGSYFRNDAAAGSVRPLPQAALAKYLSDPRVSEVYDSGQYQVYYLGALWRSRVGHG